MESDSPPVSPSARSLVVEMEVEVERISGTEPGIFLFLIISYYFIFEFTLNFFKSIQIILMCSLLFYVCY